MGHGPGRCPDIRVLFARWFLIPALLLAAVVAAGLFNRGPEWVVTPSSPSAVLYIDDAPAAYGDTGRLRKAFRTLGTLRTGDSTLLALRLPGAVVLEMDAGTEVRCPNTPGRFADTDVSVPLLAGTLRVMTGREFVGRRLLVLTPEARLAVNGTVFSVTRKAAETVVAVYQGSVEAVGPGVAPAVVMAGRQAVLAGRDSKPVQSPLDGAESARLGRLMDRLTP